MSYTVSDFQNPQDFAESFSRRAYLVRLNYERGSFTFSIKHNEASNALEAARIAKRRFTSAVGEDVTYLHGYLQGIDVKVDTDKQRASFGVSPKEEIIRYGDRWFAA
jgi:hypothetical protein